MHAIFQAAHLTKVPEPAAGTSACGDIVFPKTPAEQLPQELIGHQAWQSLEVTHTQAAALERETQQQASCAAWFSARQHRLTASKIGSIMLRVSQPSQAFVRNLLSSKHFTSKPTNYGSSKEEAAKQQYLKAGSRHLHRVGLLVNPAFPFLGASPDGIVCEEGAVGIIEIKCPYSARNETIAEACTRAEFFLDSAGKLKHQHEHYYQVQTQLLVSGAPFCDFIVYTQHDLHVERIYPDPATMKDILKKASDLYINFIWPYLNQSSSTN